MKEYVYVSKFDIGDHLLECTWSGHVANIPKAKADCLDMLDKIKKYQLHKVLNDNRKQIGMWPDIREWLLDEWIPALSEGGLKYFAHVMSPDESTNQEAMKVFNQIHHGVEFVTFTSYLSAQEWLKKN